MKRLNSFIRDLYHYAEKRLLINIALMLISGLMAGVGVVMLIPLLSLTGVVDGETTNYPLFAQFFSFFNGFEKSERLLMVLVTYIAVISLQAIINRKQSILNMEIIQGYTKHRRISLYQKVLNADWLTLAGRKNSDIVNAFTIEINRVAAGTIYLLQIIAQSIMALFHLAISFMMSPLLTLFVLFCGSLIFLYLNSSLRESKKLGLSLHKINQDLFSSITEQLHGVKEVKSYGIEQSQLSAFTKTSIDIEKNMVDFVRVQTKPDLYYKIGAAIAVSLFFYFAVNFFKVEPAALLIIIFIFSRLWPVFSSFQNNLQNIFVMLPSFAALKQLEEDFSQNAETMLQSSDIVSPLAVEKSITLENVSFRYNENQDSFSIQNLNLKIPAKTMVALVGRSGCGKTTIVDLLLGLLQPQNGTVLIDGLPVNSDLLKSWRKSIGYVPQDPFLLNNTIRENLLRFTPKASEIEINNALKSASALEFIQNLPDGLNTVIGDRGIKLSGGERQRIVLARALLRKPQILVLDEATSALDSHNEYKIQTAVEQLRGSMTVVVIAHRLSTIQHADTIVVIDRGAVVESGTYAELTNRDEGFFKRLLNSGSLAATAD